MRFFSIISTMIFLCTSALLADVQISSGSKLPNFPSSGNPGITAVPSQPVPNVEIPPAGPEYTSCSHRYFEEVIKISVFEPKEKNESNIGHVYLPYHVIKTYFNVKFDTVEGNKMKISLTKPESCIKDIWIDVDNTTVPTNPAITIAISPSDNILSKFRGKRNHDSRVALIENCLSENDIEGADESKNKEEDQDQERVKYKYKNPTNKCDSAVFNMDPNKGFPLIQAVTANSSDSTLYFSNKTIDTFYDNLELYLSQLQFEFENAGNGHIGGYMDPVVNQVCKESRWKNLLDKGETIYSIRDNLFTSAIKNVYLAHKDRQEAYIKAKAEKRREEARAAFNNTNTTTGVNVLNEIDLKIIGISRNIYNANSKSALLRILSDLSNVSSELTDVDGSTIDPERLAASKAAIKALREIISFKYNLM